MSACPVHGRRKPRIQIVIRPYATTEVGYRAFKANELDVAELPGGDVAAWRGRPELKQTPAPSVIYLAPNMQARPFNDVHCRLAVSYIACPSPDVDMLDEQSVGRLVRRFVIPALTTGGS